MTSTPIAEKARTSHSYLSQVERGEKVASPLWMRAVLDAFADNLAGGSATS